MEQEFTGAQYIGMIVATVATIMYVGGLYLVLTDKHNAKKERRDNELR